VECDCLIVGFIGILLRKHLLQIDLEISMIQYIGITKYRAVTLLKELTAIKKKLC
jgi:hypothetical protein